VGAVARRVLRRPLDAGERRDGVETVVRLTLLLSATAVVLLVVTHLVNRFALDNRVNAFDADADDSAWGWAGVVAESSTALLLGLLAVTSARRRAVTFAAFAVAFLSLDDFLALHERVSRIGEHLPFSHADRVVWPLVFLPLFAVVFVLLWRVAEGEVNAVRAIVRGGLLALVLAVGLEMGSSLLFAEGEGHGSVPYESEVAVEEALELAGWTWIAGGMAATLLDRRAP
jgi:hypothetical protein